jgi:hypothetical protein
LPSRAIRRCAFVVTVAIAAAFAVSPVLAAAPTGERHFGNVTVEPAYNDSTGSLLYILTPDKAPNPISVDAHAVSPLYLVLYPPRTHYDEPFNCEGVNTCPDHALEVATAATQINPLLYGTDPYAIPGHDHLIDPPGGAEWNVPWGVILVVFTNAGAVHHITTDADLDATVASGGAVKVDTGITFLCSAVPARVYWHGTPVFGEPGA